MFVGRSPDIQEVIFMTGTTILRFVLETLAVLAVTYCLFHQDEINEFERKMIRFLKRAKRIISEEYHASRNAKAEKAVNNIIEFKSKNDVEAQYEFLLNQVS
jgi:hypothetical protein